MSNRLNLESQVEGMSETEARSVVTFIHYLEECQASQASQASKDEAARPSVLQGALAIPQSEWRVTLDGFSHVFFDIACHLWVTSKDGERTTLAKDVPLGQVYFDEKGSERNAVQVAINRSGSVYGDFRFMHRVAEPEAIYLKSTYDGEFADLIIESGDTLTVLEMGTPVRPAPGIRSQGFAFRRLIKNHKF